MNLHREAGCPPGTPSPEPVTPASVQPDRDADLVSLDELLTIGAEDIHRPRAHVSGRHRRRPDRAGWLCLVDRVLGDWPRTLRASLVLALVLLALVVSIAELVNVRPTLCVAGLYVLHRLVHRRRLQRVQAA